MDISKSDLDWAAEKGVITTEQSAQLWNALEVRFKDKPHFTAVHIAYYFGAMLVISSMGWFMTLAIETLGGWGIFTVALAYAIAFILAGAKLWFKDKQRIPGGLLYTIAVSMTPLIIYGLERATGLWPEGSPGSYQDFHRYVNGAWILMEAATIAAGLGMLLYIRFPFLTAPIAFSCWYLSMDLAPLLTGGTFEYEQRLWVSVLVGLLMLLGSYLVDCRTDEDYSFWGYFFGMLAFWFGLTLMNSNSELNKFFYLLINLGLIFCAVLLSRRIFLVFGSFGVMGYLGHLAWSVFEGSLLFPFALSFIGIAVIFIGIKLQKRVDTLGSTLKSRVPENLRWIIPSERRKPAASAVAP